MSNVFFDQIESLIIEEACFLHDQSGWEKEQDSAEYRQIAFLAFTILSLTLWNLKVDAVPGCAKYFILPLNHCTATAGTGLNLKRKT